MMKRIEKKDIIIVLLSLILLIFTISIESNKNLVKDKWYDEKYKASQLMEESMEKIRKEKVNRKIEIDVKEDINNTGIIGVEFNGITTTLGSLDSKRTSANPNFAAVMVDLMKEAKFKKGDSIAINFSSSFPALNIATIAACEVLELDPIIISSIGSSTWGGNNLDFTYIDMEEFLFEENIIHHKSKAISPGGAGDIGKDMNQDDLKIILNRMKDYDKKIIIEEDLEKNIDTRYNIYYEDAEKIEGFINVGGNIVSFGDTTDSTKTSPGLIKNQNYKINDKNGLVQLYYSKGVPTIQILNIKDLAHKYGLKIDPNTPFILGEGDVYYTYEYPYKLITLVIIVLILILITYNRRMKISYD